MIIEDIIYFAGLFDGEGSVEISQTRQRGGTLYYELAIRVVNTDEDIMLWLVNVFGGSLYARKRVYHNCKQSFTWSLGPKKSLWLLKLVLPYLRIKKKRAELAIYFEEGKIERGRNRGRFGFVRKLDKYRVLEEAQFILMRELNQRGTMLGVGPEGLRRPAKPGEQTPTGEVNA